MGNGRGGRDRENAEAVGVAITVKGKGDEWTDTRGVHDLVVAGRSGVHEWAVAEGAGNGVDHRMATEGVGHCRVTDLSIQEA